MSMMSKEKLKNYFSSMPKTFCILALVMIFMTTVILNFRKKISISVDGQVMSITTLSSNLRNALMNNGIAVGEKDKISVDLNSKLKDGDKIQIRRAVNVKLMVDGEEKTIKTSEHTIKDMLAAENITISEKDKISVSLDEKIVDNLTLKITKVNEEVKDIVEPIQFAKEVKQSDSYKVGTTKVLQEGINGEKVVSTKIVYEDGKEVSRKVVGEKVLKKAINQIMAVGTLKTYTASRGGNFAYSKVLSVKASAYTADFNPSGVRDDPYAGMTATGVRAKRDPNGYSTIAVDPRVIPLGTKVYVEGYGYAIAQDTGGSIKGNIIDLYMNKYSEAMRWGRRTVKVYILK